MNRSLLSVVFVGMAMLGFGQIRMDVSQNGKSLGKLYLTEKLSATGKTVDMRLELKGPSGEVEIRQSSTFERSGAPIRKLKDTLLKPKTRLQVVVSFTAGKANVVLDESGRRSTKEIPLAKGATAQDASEFWFRPVAPKVGAVVKCVTFDLDRLTWVELSTSYLGKVKVEVRGVQRDLHRVVAVQSGRTVETLLDDKGDPVRIVDGAIRVEREN
ncbi:MAG: hypothetical protein ACOYON_01140 [Fimbriimonas sp.]